MIEKFNQMKELMELKKQADVMKKEMEKIHTKVYEGEFEAIVRGDQYIEEISRNGERQFELEKLVNKAIKESQKEVAKKMKGQLSGLGFPGL